MTRDQLEAEARRQVADFPPTVVEWIGKRALGRAVWCWTYLKPAELNRIIGACAAARLIWSPS